MIQYNNNIFSAMFLQVLIYNININNLIIEKNNASIPVLVFVECFVPQTK